MMHHIIMNCLKQHGSLPCIRKSFRRKPSAEPTTLAQSIVGYTFSFFAAAFFGRSLSYRAIPEVNDAI